MPKLTRQAFRYELAPTAAQREFLTSCAGASRFWFNQGLALVKTRLDERASGQDVSVPWSYKSLCSEIGQEVRAELAPWQREVVSGSYQAGFEALGKALQSFSAGRRKGRTVGFPRFRRKGACTESVIFQRPAVLDSRHVGLDKKRLGPVRTKESLHKLTRLLARDEDARILRSTVMRSGTHWHISFTVERSAEPKAASRQPRRAAAVVGVDVGLSRLATLSTGETFENAQPLGHSLQKLRRLQRQLNRQRRSNNPTNYDERGRAKPGRTWTKSHRQTRTEVLLQRLHERVADVRREQAHQLTTALTREYGVIGIETLTVMNLMANRRLARHIADVGWGTIFNQLRYKTSWAGSTLVAADRFYPSSKTCSACGTVRAKLSLTERVLACEACGRVQDRDLNAALNLARVAQRFAQAEGSQCYVAAAGAETGNSRGGHVSPAPRSRQTPVETRRPFGVIPAPQDAGGAYQYSPGRRQEQLGLRVAPNGTPATYSDAGSGRCHGGGEWFGGLAHLG
ncbi:MAG TPA: RNA-guided endonuclease TnpB family protein [Solirubrobacteraceae bacterium]|nr:RNA-guided endonuclease TnpB family protein [Solirubrobacteraceae bacterium]